MNARNRKYTQEQVDMVMAATKRFTNDYGKISWERMVVEAPEIIAMAGTLKRIQQLYRRTIDNAARNRPVIRSQQPWAKEELARLVSVVEASKNSRGKIDWVAMQDSGQIADLLATRSLKNVRDRYFYEIRYKGDYQKKAQEKRKAKRHATTDDIGHHRLAATEQFDDYEDREVLAAREAELARQARVAGGLPSVAGKIGYCPFCGNNISAILNLNIQ